MAVFRPICVSKALYYLDRHFQDSGIRLIDVARQAGCSEGHLSRQLQRHLGMGFRDLLCTARVNAAKTLLQGPQVSMKSVAFDVGYSHPSAFTRDFGRAVGMSPSRWRAHVFDPARDATTPSTPGWPAAPVSVDTQTAHK